MKRVVYHISGFDCPHCAARVESFLRKDENITECSLDFSNDRLYINYKDNPYKLEQLKEKIKEVESNSLRIEEINKGTKNKIKILTQRFIFNLIRIGVAVTFIVLGKVLEVLNGEFFIPSVVLYILAASIMIYDIIWKFIQNIIHLRNPIDMNLLLTISCLGVFTLGFLNHFDVFGVETSLDVDLFDGAMVITLYQIGELVEAIATGKSKAAISNAIDLRADTANLIVNDKVVKVKPEELKVNDKIIVHIGDIVPADGIIIDGQGTLDMSSLNGEPMPVDALVGNNVLSGAILRSGSITIQINKVFADSTISKIMELVQSSGERKARAEKFIDKFAKIYTPSVFALAIIFTLISGFTGLFVWPKALFTGFAILVVSCPCAIVISVPLAYFAGVGLASKHGIVIKGANYLDSLCNVGLIFIDKTGTLTYGNFELKSIVPYQVDESELKECLLAAESRSNHPIAKAICLHQNTSDLALKQEFYEEVPGLGISTVYNGHKILAGNFQLLEKNGVFAKEIEGPGTIIYVAKDGKFIGYVTIEDTIRDKAKILIKKLNELGIKTVLLSGDKNTTVSYVANEVGIKYYHSNLLPQEKTKFVEEAISNKKDKKAIAFAGDGINDTPSIIRADIGFAMGGIGSDIAVENADVVIMQDHPLKIYDSIKIARKTRVKALFNIIFALLVKVSVIVLLILGILGEAAMLVAMIADTGLTVLLTINSWLLIYSKVK